MKKLITVFTPSYNRAYVLINLYNSLMRQTSKNFIWHIVDDGSADNTEKLIKELIAENGIDIRYEYQQNGGKHVAHNRAVEKCCTELFMCVDSDDYLTDDAIQTIEERWLKEKEKEKLSGIVANRGDKNGNVIGTEFPKKIMRAGLSQLYREGKKGDTTIAFRTEVIKRFPFPVFEGERFLREHIVYDEIDKEYDLLVLNKIICICEYLEDGLSKNATQIEFKNPKGAALARLHDADKSLDVFSKTRNLAAYVLYSIIGNEFCNACKRIGYIKALLLLPLSAVGYIRYIIKRHN